MSPKIVIFRNYFFVRGMSHNGLALGAVEDFGAQNWQGIRSKSRHTQSWRYAKRQVCFCI